MTSKFLTTTILLMVVSWLQGIPIDAHAETFTVPGDYSTIAEAFAAARSGDRVEVAPGLYPETHLILPSGVVFVGTGTSPEQVIIDGQGRGRILLAESLDQATIIANISFINGHAAGYASYERSGGAIFCSNSSLRISNCIFTGNISDGHGGAIRCNGSAPLITGCVFVDNHANSGGGAIDFSFDSSPLLRGCEFRGNTAEWGGALSCRGTSSPTIVTSIFEGNEAVGTKGYGGAVFADFGSGPVFRQSTYTGNTARYGGALACFSNAETNLENCTITGNSAQVLGGGLFIYDATPRITGSIIAFQEGTGISVAGGAAPVIACSDIFGNTGGDWVGDIASQLGVDNNITADPLFCGDSDAGALPIALMDNSPASSSDLDCGYMGAWPIGCDAVGTTVSAFDVLWSNRQAQMTWQARTFGIAEPEFRLTGSLAAGPGPEWDISFADLGGGYFEATDSGTDANSGDTYIYRLYMAEAGSGWVLLDEVTLTSVPDFAGIRELKASPNPFNPMTTISFRLGRSQRAQISVYSPSGRRIAVLADRIFGSGLQTQIWDGRDSQGNRVSSGIYLVLVEGEATRQTRKITLLK